MEGYIRGDPAHWTDPHHSHFAATGKEAGLGPSSEVNNPTAQEVQRKIGKKKNVSLRKNTKRKSAAHGSGGWRSPGSQEDRSLS